jgi:hypothetical protein
MIRAFVRRSLELTPQQWQTLEQLAAQFGTTAPTGPAAGQPSWRTLIKRDSKGSPDRDLKIQPPTNSEEHKDAI